MRIAISLNFCKNRCAEEAMIPRLAAAGFDGLDFNFCDMLDRINWSDDDAVARLLAPWQQAADAASMKWVQAHGPMFSMFSSAHEDQRRKSLCAAAIRAAGRLGVPWIVLHPDVFAGPFDSAHRCAILEGNLAFFRNLLPECDKANVGIAIENIFDAAGQHGNRGCPRFYGSVPEEQCELIDRLNHPLIGACWDTGHGRLMNLSAEVVLPLFGKRLKALHIHDNDGKSDQHLLPFAGGRGGVDWPGFVRGLRGAGYQGAFTYEVHNGLAGVPDACLDATLRFITETARVLLA